MISKIQSASNIKEIWYTPCPVVLATHIALTKGWLTQEFAKDGIKLRHIAELPVEKWQAHYTHRIYPLFRDGGNIPPIWARSEGADTKVIGMIWVERSQAILVRKDSSITSVKELKGKRIALLRWLRNLIDFPRAMEKRAIIMSLKAHGLSADGVRFVDIPIDVSSMAREKPVGKVTIWESEARLGWKLPQQPEVDALLKGEVDAIWAYGGQEVVLEQAGVARTIFNLNRHPEMEYRVNIDHPYVCTVNADFAQEHPDLVIRWLKVLIKAGMWASDHPDEVIAIASSASNISGDAVRKALPPDFHQHLIPEISDKGIKALEIERDFLKEHGFINNSFDVRSWVDDSLLKTAREELKDVST